MTVSFYLYICMAIFCIIVFIIAHICSKHRFWIIQPVFHIYDISYFIRPPGIIQHCLPSKNKYTNFQNIDTFVFSKLKPHHENRLCNFIRTNYLQNKDNVFEPKLNNILPYFIGHNSFSFLSFYFQPINLVEKKTNRIITDKEIIGTITSRPLHIIFYNDRQNKNKRVDIDIYYVDYLCVHPTHRKKGIAPQLIQTHHYNQRHLNQNITISLFKREDELTGIVPLCVYSTYGFSVEHWTKPPDLASNYKIIEINPHNYHTFHGFLMLNTTQFDICIYPYVSNILELLKSKNIFIYSVLSDDEIICCYFYRKTCVQIQKNLEVLSCFASIQNCEDDIFVQGFKIAFWKIAFEHHFGFAAIENISHNHVIIDNIQEKTNPTIISPTAYFFYNFAHPSFSPKKTFIVN